MWVKVENNEVIQWGLAETGFLKDGSGVSGYNKLDEETLISEGWMPYIDTRPEYNPETEEVVSNGYVIGETEVVANYIVIALEPVQMTPMIEEYLIDLDFRICLIELGLV